MFWVASHGWSCYNTVKHPETDVWARKVTEWCGGVGGCRAIWTHEIMHTHTRTHTHTHTFLMYLHPASSVSVYHSRSDHGCHVSCVTVAVHTGPKMEPSTLSSSFNLRHSRAEHVFWCSSPQHQSSGDIADGCRSFLWILMMSRNQEILTMTFCIWWFRCSAATPPPPRLHDQSYICCHCRRKRVRIYK